MASCEMVGLHKDTIRRQTGGHYGTTLPIQQQQRVTQVINRTCYYNVVSYCVTVKTSSGHPGTRELSVRNVWENCSEGRNVPGNVWGSCSGKGNLPGRLSPRVNRQKCTKDSFWPAILLADPAELKHSGYLLCTLSTIKMYPLILQYVSNVHLMW